MSILVIKLGALGDMIQAYRAMAAIRAHHPDERIVLLTIPSLRGLTEAFGLFDEVWTDERPGILKPHRWLDLGRKLNGARFTRVYDLQANGRTGRYHRLMSPPFGRRPQWSGIAKGCSHPHANPIRATMHNLERHADQLTYAGIATEDYPPLDMSWVNADVSRFGLAGKRYVLLAPGSAPSHPQKRWPAAHYAELARRLAERGYTPVVLGGPAEADACAQVAAAPGAVNLCGQTSLLEVMALGRYAAAAVGNDTGPMHLVAVMGPPCLVLYSGSTEPARTRPRGPYEGPGALPVPPGRKAQAVTVLRRPKLADLSVDEVWDSLEMPDL